MASITVDDRHYSTVDEQSRVFISRKLAGKRLKLSVDMEGRLMLSVVGPSEGRAVDAAGRIVVPSLLSGLYEIKPTRDKIELFPVRIVPRA